MKKLLNIMLAAALAFGLNVPIYAEDAVDAKRVEIKGDREISLFVGDTLALTAEASKAGDTYYRWWTEELENAVITLTGDSGETVVKPSEETGVTQSAATIKAVAAGDAVVKVYADSNPITAENLENLATDSVTIHVAEKNTVSFEVSSYNQSKEKEHQLAGTIDNLGVELDKTAFTAPADGLYQEGYAYVSFLDFKTADEETPYPAIDKTTVTLSLAEGGETAFGKDFKLFFVNGEEREEISVAAENGKLQFPLGKLGQYVLYYNAYTLTVTFYDGETVYHTVTGLKPEASVTFPSKPEKDGYVFTGWKVKNAEGKLENPTSILAKDHDAYYASWCDEEKYKTIKLTVSPTKLTRGKEDGQRLTLKANYGKFADTDILNDDVPENWKVVGESRLSIEKVNRKGDRTLELVLSGSSKDIYKNATIYVEMNSALLLPDQNDLGEITTGFARLDKNGIQERYYQTDDSIKLEKQSSSSGSGGSGGGGGGGITIVRYVITFHSNGGSQVATQSAVMNTAVSRPVDPQRDGYTFAGWYIDESLTIAYDFKAAVTKNLNLYAKWTSNDAGNQLIFTVDKLEAKVFGVDITNDVAPVIRNDRSFLPARFVAENLGAVVEWNPDNRTVIITKDDIRIVLAIDSDTATVNDEAVTLDHPAFIENDRTYTPIRFIAEKLGAGVDWNPDTREIIITK